MRMPIRLQSHMGEADSQGQQAQSAISRKLPDSSFTKCSQLFLCMNNVERSPVAAMCVCDPDCSALRIQRLRAQLQPRLPRAELRRQGEGHHGLCPVSTSSTEMKAPSVTSTTVSENSNRAWSILYWVESLRFRPYPVSSRTKLHPKHSLSITRDKCRSVIECLVGFYRCDGKLDTGRASIVLPPGAPLITMERVVPLCRSSHPR